VALTILDSAGNSTVQSWSVLTDVIPPGSPSLTATTKNPRTASFNLAWTATADDGVSGAPGSTTPVSGYALGSSTTLNPSSEAQFNQMSLDPGAAALTGAAVGTTQSYVLSGLPTFNSYFVELRAVDAVGNRSALVTASTVATIGDGGIPNTLQVATITGPADVRFGYRLVEGDFNVDGRADLAMSAPPLPGPVTGYVLSGAADLSSWNQAVGSIAGVVTLTSGASTTDLFGYALAVGDFDGDGFDDLAVGAPFYNNDQGLVSIYFG